MFFEIDQELIQSLLQMSIWDMSWVLFINGGWIIMLIFVAAGAWQGRLYYKQNKFAASIEYTFLAVDIPRLNEQTCKAVEQMFATVAGAHTPFTLGEKYIEGKTQLSFSFEIVSIDGYLQYIIRTPSIFRDLIESAVYAQYPDAEITEVEDYAKDMPKIYPDPKYNVWGSELALANKWQYPIKTYPEFEDQLSGEFKDPMAAILETMNNIRPGEQFWIQLITIPEGFEWPKKSHELALKIAGKKVNKKSGGLLGILEAISGFFRDWLMFHSTLWMGPEENARDNNEMPSMMLHLTPGEKNALEAIERKASKIGFQCKIRIVYISPKEMFQAQRVVSSVFGSLKQFNYNDLNGLKPDMKTKTTGYYGFANWKKNRRRTKIMRNYINRSHYAGSKTFILNIEELATLYHFPTFVVKAPLLPRLETKKSEGPSYLPTESEQDDFTQSGSQIKRDLENLKIHNDYYERRYAINKDLIKPKPPGEEGSKIPDNLPIA